MSHKALLKWYYPGRLTGHEFVYSASMKGSSLAMSSSTCWPSRTHSCPDLITTKSLVENNSPCSGDGLRYDLEVQQKGAVWKTQTARSSCLATQNRICALIRTARGEASPPRKESRHIDGENRIHPLPLTPPPDRVNALVHSSGCTIPVHPSNLTRYRGMLPLSSALKKPESLQTLVQPELPIRDPDQTS